MIIIDKIKSVIEQIWIALTTPFLTYTTGLEQFCMGSGMVFWAYAAVLTAYSYITKQRLAFVKK